MIKNRFVLIDAFALIHRAYHAIPPLTSSDGKQINAVYGFSSALLSAIKTLEPEYLAVGVDLPKPTLRHKEFVEYKAQRAPMPEELRPQIPIVMEVLKTMNVPTFGVEGYEGEDVIATIVAKVKANPRSAISCPQKGNINIPNSGKRKAESGNANMEFIIVTGDMDTLQLIDKNTKVYSMSRGINQAVMYDIEKVNERYGLTPEQFVDFKALKGDPSDNIPGVPGIGEKGAAKLIIDFKNLENIYNLLEGKFPRFSKKSYNNIEKIPQKYQAILKENKEQAFLSKKLSKISAEAPLEFKLSDARAHDYNRANTIKLFQSFGFQSLISRLPDEDKKENQQKLF